jgi:hypothetical protein
MPENYSTLIDWITEYETGDLSPKQTLELFSQLIKNGILWQLQGSYQRTARTMMDQGYLDSAGNILSYQPKGEQDGRQPSKDQQ